MNNFKQLGFMISIVGVVIFMLGIHTTDNGFNLHVLNCATNGNYIDQSLNGNEFTVKQMYSLGIEETIAGFLLTIAGLLISTMTYSPKLVREIDDFFKE